MRSSSRGIAYAGAISSPSRLWTWSTAAVWASMKYACTGIPCSAAHSSLASSTVEAPSLSGVELPAVIVPSDPPNTGFSLASCLQARVGAQVLVALEPLVGDDEVVEEAAVVGRRQLAVALDRELVLLLARDAPLARHDRGVLAHRQARPRLGVARDLGDDLLRAELCQRPEPLGV